VTLSPLAEDRKLLLPIEYKEVTPKSVASEENNTFFII
jgi:hypothetical protein